MFTRDRVHTSRERNIGRNNPDVHSVLAVFFQRNLAPADAGDGVSTYLALIFGTLLSSQGTDASFVLTRETLSGFPPGASLRSCVSDSIRPFPDPISSVLSRFPLFFRGFLSGGSDFIRSSESDFPPPAGRSGHMKWPGSPRAEP